MRGKKLSCPQKFETVEELKKLRKCDWDQFASDSRAKRMKMCLEHF